MSVRKAAGLESNDYAPRLGEKVDKADLIDQIMPLPWGPGQYDAWRKLVDRMQSSVTPSEFYGVGLQDAFDNAAENAATFGNAPIRIGVDATAWVISSDWVNSTSIVAQAARSVPTASQRGWFGIPKMWLEEFPETVLAILDGVVVWEASTDVVADVVRYCGTHTAFDKVNTGEVAPNYSFELMQGTRIWRRLGK